MYRSRRFVFPMLLLGLIALAAFGVWQVIGGLGEAQEEPALETKSFDPENVPSRDEEQREIVRQFIESGDDVCSLREGDFGHGAFRYPDLATLVNGVDLVVLGRAGETVLLPPDPDTIVGRVITTVQVDEVLKGSVPGPSITLESGHRVEGRPGPELSRGSSSKFDICDTGAVLLFLEPSRILAEHLLFSWAPIEGEAVEGSLTGPFEEFQTRQALLSQVRAIVAQQQAEGLPKGRLFCEFNRTPAGLGHPIVCPGENFNPYQALQLESAGGAWVTTEDPGPSLREVANFQLDSGDPQLQALLLALNLDVAVEPAGVRPDDVIRLSVVLAESVRDPANFSFEYSPSSGMIQLFSSGQFPAPPAFQQAMAPFLASSVVE